MTDLQERHLSGISFDWVVVRELRFVDNPDDTGPQPLEGMNAAINVETKLTEDSRSCRVVLKLSLTPPPNRRDAFQAMSVSVEGQFSLQEGGASTVPIEEFSRKQAPAILMPFVREAVASATSKSRFGQVLIPPINVVALVEEMQKAPQSQQG
jgi:preprotein translocase subunit SecB